MKVWIVHRTWNVLPALRNVPVERKIPLHPDDVESLNRYVLDLNLFIDLSRIWMSFLRRGGPKFEWELQRDLGGACTGWIFIWWWSWSPWCLLQILRNVEYCECVMKIVWMKFYTSKENNANLWICIWVEWLKWRSYVGKERGSYSFELLKLRIRENLFFCIFFVEPFP